MSGATLPYKQGVTPRLARSEGQVEVSIIQKNGNSVIKRLFQSGCGRVRFPEVDHKDLPEAVLINTSGGLTGGDGMAYRLSAEAGAGLTVTGQAAEKIYKSLGDPVHINSDITVGADAYLEWMPQETILFDRSHLDRLNRVELEETATFLGVEANVFGRTAHGEVVRDIKIRDAWQVRRGGKLIWFDRFLFDGNAHEELSRPALLNGAVAMGTIICAGKNVAELVDPLREKSEEMESRVGISALEDDFIILRIMDENAARFRVHMMTIIRVLRNSLRGGDNPMPTVWKI
ncbi:MAG: urease accessory protein UreD [Sneathiella sp.]|nr:urease accessory protein UreD [Sneathiella sp.]